MSSGYSQSASLRSSTANSCSAVYQEELALLLIQASPPPTAYCFSQLKQGTYLIWLNGDKLGGIYAEKEQQLLIIKYEIIAFINA